MAGFLWPIGEHINRVPLYKKGIFKRIKSGLPTVPPLYEHYVPKTKLPGVSDRFLVSGF